MCCGNGVGREKKNWRGGSAYEHRQPSIVGVPPISTLIISTLMIPTLTVLALTIGTLTARAPSSRPRRAAAAGPGVTATGLGVPLQLRNKVSRHPPSGRPRSHAGIRSGSSWSPSTAVSALGASQTSDPPARVNRVALRLPTRRSGSFRPLSDCVCRSWQSGNCCESAPLWLLWQWWQLPQHCTPNYRPLTPK